ncbi:efflux RND transporter periplasmic adaptor subunit [soil metagenome]
MKRRTKVVAIVVTALVVTGAFAARSFAGSSTDESGPPSVTVTRGDLVQKALAVGTIEPQVEISVKSKVSGVVREMFVEEGGFVRAGEPLMDVRPDPTPLELVEARRQLELREIEMQNARHELERSKELAERELIARQDLESTQRRHDEAALQLRMAREKLELLERGRIRGSGSGVESVVRAPVTGFVLEKMVETGDPVVPLSTYQEGTVLMTMANMDNLIFRGTVDEIDVGKLVEGMPVEIKVGALPDARIQGVVTRISLKAKKQENATTFPVEIALTQTGGATLRSGLSANAEIIIQKRESVLTLPERVVTFEGDSAWVTVPVAEGQSEKRWIRTGLSDAIQVEVTAGLQEGEKVLEKPAKQIE